ncbi:MAG: hypothetical protein IKZ72_02245 [Bacteroidales bacterium]|nr:hypothetical protein [Bacteroidales bacterium]
MKKILLTLLSAAALLVCACDKYDDTPLRNELSGLESRVSNLEDLCSKLNANIASIQTLLENINAKIAIERVVSLDNGEGYLITFSNGSSITVYNGVDGPKGNKGDKGDKGDPGEAPVIGVASEDGVLYWTLNGEWLTDDEGQKIPVVGPKGDKGDQGEQGEPGNDGKDGSSGRNGSNGSNGVTPQLKIQDGKWMVSYDNGSSWNEVTTSGDNPYNTMALTIEETEDAYIITLDGESYTISKAAEAAVSFQIKVDSDDVAISGQSVTISYTLTGGDETTHVVAEGSLSAVVDESACTVTIYGDENTEGYVILRAIRNSDGAYSAQYIAVAGGTFTILTAEEVTVDGNGETFEVKVKTNLEYSVDLPDWITEEPETKAVRTDTKKFTAAANTTGAERSAAITFKTSDGSFEKAVVVTQPEGTQTSDEVKTVTVAEFNAAEESDTQVYELVGTIGGTINATYGNFDLTDDSGTVYVYGLTATELGYGADNDKSYASLNLKAGDKIKIHGYRGSYKDKIEVMYAWFIEKLESGDDPGGDDPDPGEASGDFASSITWTLGSSAYNQDATVNGEAVSVLKLGTSSKAGDATLTIPEGVTKIGFYAVAWKGLSTADIDFGGETVTVSGNEGATGNPVYTISVTDDDYYEIEVSEGDLAITSAKRVIIFGINAK